MMTLRFLTVDTIETVGATMILLQKKSLLTSFTTISTDAACVDAPCLVSDTNARTFFLLVPLVCTMKARHPTEIIKTSS